MSAVYTEFMVVALSFARWMEIANITEIITEINWAKVIAGRSASC